MVMVFEANVVFVCIAMLVASPLSVRVYEGVGVVGCDGGVIYLSDCFIKPKGDVSGVVVGNGTVQGSEGYGGGKGV